MICEGERGTRFSERIRDLWGRIIDITSEHAEQWLLTKDQSLIGQMQVIKYYNLMMKQKEDIVMETKRGRHRNKLWSNYQSLTSKY